MIEIYLAVCGDHWLNPQALHDNFPANNDETLVLRMSGEGPSLWATGIVQETLDLCAKHSRAPGTVWVGDWSNRVEEVPFARFTNHAMSHFFWMSDSYRHTEIPPAAHRRWFAYFMGRANLHRARMLQDILKHHGQDTMVSVMQGSGLKGVDSMPHEPGWLQDQEADSFYQWCRLADTPSIDNHAVRDQYDPVQNTNRDILAVYDQFRIEIVAETYTLGDCFFPTEKTVRPLSQGRGLLLYGPRNFLARLRALGFQTWNTIWDETYDQAEGNLRWQLIETEMRKIQHMDPDQVEHRLQEIKGHNRRVLDQLVHAFQPQ